MSRKQVSYASALVRSVFLLLVAACVPTPATTVPTPTPRTEPISPLVSAPTSTSLPTSVPTASPTPTAPAQPAMPPPRLHKSWTSYTNANYVTDMVFDHDGNLWVTSSGGVVRWNLAGNTHTKYTTEHGLASNGVESVAVAPDGALWFGTQHGVSRFTDFASNAGDGGTWTTYVIDECQIYSSGCGLAHHGVNAIAVSPDGTLWFGTYGGGISHLTGPATSADDKESWVTYTAQDGLASNYVTSIAVTPDGELWVGTDIGVSRFDGQSWTTYTADDGLAGNAVHAIAATPDGALWFGTYHGLSRFDGRSWVTYTAKDGLPDNWVQSIATDLDGTLWIGTHDGGVSHLDGQTWVTYVAQDGLAQNDVRALVVSPDGTLWAGTWGSGISRFHQGTWTVYATDDGLAHNWVRAVVVAPDGTLWIGTQDGVSRFDGQTWATYTSADGVDDDVILSIAVTPDGALWFGKEYGGLSRFDGQDWTTYTFAGSPTGQVVLVGNSIFSIAVAPDGALWLGTRMGGVYRFAGPVHRIGDIEAWTIYTTDDGLVSSRIDAIAVAPDGTLWFGSADSVPRNGGVSHFTGPARGAGDGETWTTYTENDGLASDTVNAIAVAPDGALWFGTGHAIFGYGGASRFSGPAAGAGADGAWTTYTAKDGLGSNVVLSIAIAPNDVLWFGTHGGGVSRFGGEPVQLSADDEAWITYTTRDGLGSNFVWCIAAAPDGTLWFGTSNGLSRYSPPS